MLKCLYCECTFVCQSDLDKHLKRFGELPFEHVAKFKDVLFNRQMMLLRPAGWQDNYWSREGTRIHH